MTNVQLWCDDSDGKCSELLFGIIIDYFVYVYFVYMLVPPSKECVDFCQ